MIERKQEKTSSRRSKSKRKQRKLLKLRDNNHQRRKSRLSQLIKMCQKDRSFRRTRRMMMRTEVMSMIQTIKTLIMMTKMMSVTVTTQKIANPVTLKNQAIPTIQMIQTMTKEKEKVVMKNQVRKLKKRKLNKRKHQQRLPLRILLRRSSRPKKERRKMLSPFHSKFKINHITLISISSQLPNCHHHHQLLKLLR